MAVQLGLCRTCSKTTLLVFSRDGSNTFFIDEDEDWEQALIDEYIEMQKAEKEAKANK